MKIKIEHICNMYNCGSLMMAVTLISYLSMNIKDVELYVDTFDKNNLERIKKESGYDKIYSSISDFKYKNKIDKIIKSIKFYDLIIILGGDDISEYYMKGKWIVDFPKMRIKSMLIPTFLVGQTIGPFTGYRVKLSKFGLKKSYIYVRDDKCLEYLRKTIKLDKNLYRGRDLALRDLPNKDADNILEHYDLTYKKYVTIVASGLVERYTDNIEDYIRNYVEIIKSIKEKNICQKIVLLVHVSEPTNVNSLNDDNRVVNEIRKCIDNELMKDLVFITDDILASEARVILGKGLFTVTGRMHAAVSTLYMGKPAVSLSYSVKYAGVIGEGLGMSNLIIEASDKSLWANNEISRLVDEKINYVLENYYELAKKININVKENKGILQDELDHLLKEIQKLDKKSLNNRVNINEKEKYDF